MDEIIDEVYTKLQVWINVLESIVLRLGMTKTEYMECKFRKNRNKDEGVVTCKTQWSRDTKERELSIS